MDATNGKTGNQVDVDNTPIAVIGEAGPSGLQAGQFQPPAKKDASRMLMKWKKMVKKVTTSPVERVKVLKVILYVALKKSRVWLYLEHKTKWNKESLVISNS